MDARTLQAWAKRLALYWPVGTYTCNADKEAEIDKRMKWYGEELEQFLAAQSPWIKITDDPQTLPEHSKEVLIVVGNHVMAGWFRDPRYVSKKSAKWETINRVITGVVTHWRPLPAPPPES